MKIQTLVELPKLAGRHQDISKISIALFIAEVLYKCIREEEKNKTLFDFLHTSIQLLDEDSSGNNIFHLLFMIKLSKHLGFYPHNFKNTQKSYFDLREGLFINEIPVI